MARCPRCFLQNSLRIVNLITNLLGIAIIVYSLWLQRKWNDGVAYLPTTAHLPQPLFIYTCLGVGIMVCLSTLVGYTIANCISNSTLCICILVISSLVLLEVIVVVSIYVCRDWKSKIIEYMDHTHFTSFATFHFKMCRLITLVILIPQINIIALGIMLWIIGTDQGMERHDPDTSRVTQSFLVGSYYSIMPNASHSQQHCNACGNFNGEYESRQNFWSHIKTTIRVRFQRNSFADILA